MIFNSKKGRRLPKLALLSALLLAVVMLLASCGNGNGGTPALNVNLTNEMYEEAGGNLEMGEIEEIAKFLASNTKALEQIIAADRGYDMTAEGFDDKNLPEAKPEKAVEFAVNVLSKADTEGKLNGVSYRSINSEDIKSIINATVTNEPVVEKGLGGISKTNLNKIAKYLYENKPADDAAWTLENVKTALAAVEELEDADTDKLTEESLAIVKEAVENPEPKVSEITYDAAKNSLSQSYLIKIAETVNLADNAETLAALKASVDEDEKVDMEAALAALDNNTFDVEYTGINSGDVKLLISALRQTINTDANRNILANVMYWIGIALKWITNTVGFGNYLVGICIFAIVVELALIPFSVKQQKTQIKQAKLKPKEMAIRKKYAGRNDRVTQQKLNEEIQQLYQEENVSPLSGCLPLLIQLPIVMVLYYIVIDPMQYVFGFSTEVSGALTTFLTTSQAAGGLGASVSSTRGTIEVLSLIHEHGIDVISGIKDFALFANGDAIYGLIEGMGKIPSFNIGPASWGLNTGLIPSITRFDWLWIIPVLTFAVQFTTMKLTKKFSAAPTPTAADGDKAMACQNNMMDFMMPAMSVYIAFIVPGAVGIYWIFKGILGFVKTLIMSKIMPLPKFTEADYKAAEKEMSGKGPKKIQKSENAGKVRSLHHIDDDDYDENDNYVGDPNGEKPAEETNEEEEQSKELPENNMTEGATLKDDSDRAKSKKNKKKKNSSDNGEN